MPLIDVPLALSADQARDTALGSGRLTNGYAEPVEGGGGMAVVACDGFSAWAVPSGGSAGVIRGMVNLDDSWLYYVSGTRLQYATPSAGVFDLGAVATAGHAYFARNRRGSDGVGHPQVALVTSDGQFRIIENNAVSTPSLDPSIDATRFNSVCALDGYFIITLSNGEFYISAIDNGADIDVLDFASAQANPDGLTRGLVRGRELVLMGPRSTEFWQNTGAAGFPFERVQAVEMGVLAPAAAVPVLAAIDGAATDSIIWPATNRDGAYIGVMLLAGYDGRKISTTEVDRAITGDPAPLAIRGFQYSRDDGTTFYCVTGYDWTYEYNCRTGLWHRRTSFGLTQWRIADAVQFNGRTVFGDYSAALLYQRSSSLAPSAVATVTLRHSSQHGDDGTWSTARSVDVGASSRLGKARFNRLGRQGRDGTVFELAVTSAVVENTVGNAMTIVTPHLTGWPERLILDALFIDFVAGGGSSGRPKGVRGAKALVRATA